MASLDPCTFHVSAERRLCLPAEIVLRLDTHAQRTPDATESGGLLFGRLSDNNTCLTLCDLTEPFPGDVCNARDFAREDPGHQATAMRLWQESGGEVACWGDWHTHAEPHPEPSALDLENWRADAKLLGVRFGVTVGTETIGVWEVTRDGDVRQLDARPCLGIEIEPGHYSGCTAAQTGAKDCPTCGPRVTCAYCGESALEGEVKGWRSITCHDATHQTICPECQRNLEGEDRNPIP